MVRPNGGPVVLGVNALPGMTETSLLPKAAEGAAVANAASCPSAGEWDGVIAPAQLRHWAGVKTGENLLAVDLARVKRDLEMVSMVRSVAVERVLPHTLRLRVSEREPLAQIYIPQVRTNGSYDM